MKNFAPALLFIGICLTGCAPAQYVAYDGPTLPQDKIAVVHTDSEHNHKVFAGLDQRIYIVEIDDVSTAPFLSQLAGVEYAQTAYVKPGRHYLKLRWALGSTYADGEVWFDAQAGHTYIVRRQAQNYSVRMWVEDEESHRVVGGIPGSEPQIPKP